MSFQSMGLAAHLLRAVEGKGYTTPTEIQQKAIPPIIAGHDVLGCSQTGTGKTAAFCLPILQQLAAASQRQNSNRPPRRAPRALMIAPTRELALQIGKCLAEYSAGSPLRTTVIFGGVNQARQTRDLQRGVDMIVATPGRLLDLYEQGYVDFSQVQVVVLDEADHLLDMGFLPDVKRILDLLPRSRQSLLFSATMPPAIQELSRRFLNKPVQISVAPGRRDAELIQQGVVLVDRDAKPLMLADLIASRPQGSTLVFTRTKRGADRLAKRLGSLGMRVAAIHANKSQNARQRALADFRNGSTHILVATDIAARGIDVRGIQYVINYDFPETPESYVHRIGRTGRAGQTGNAVSFCSRDERHLLSAAERHLRTRLEVVATPKRSERVKAPAENRRPDAGPQRPERSAANRRPGSRPAARKSRWSVKKKFRHSAPA